VVGRHVIFLKTEKSQNTAKHVHNQNKAKPAICRAKSNTFDSQAHLYVLILFRNLVGRHVTISKPKQQQE
jgi:hypothetical protein